MPSTPLWNPHQVLGLGPILNRKTCQGHSHINSLNSTKCQLRLSSDDANTNSLNPTKCQLRISSDDSIEADDILEHISFLKPSSRAVDEFLVQLARLMLCNRWHRDDNDNAVNLITCWLRKIRAHEASQARAAAERRIQRSQAFLQQSDSHRRPSLPHIFQGIDPVQQFINEMQQSLERLALSTNCQVPVTSIDRRNTMYHDANNRVPRPSSGEARSMRQSGSFRGQNRPTNSCRSENDCLICWDECQALTSCPNPRCHVTMHRKCLNRWHSDRENPQCPHW